MESELVPNIYEFMDPIRTPLENMILGDLVT